MKRAVICLIGLFIVLFSFNGFSGSLSLLTGSNYKTYDEEIDQKEIITLEQYAEYSYGSIFYYWDISQPFGKDDQSEFFGSIAPMISYSKIMGKDWSERLIRDWAVKLELELVSGLTPVYFYGFSFDLNLKGLDMFLVQPVFRDDPNKRGVGGQLNVAWKKVWNFSPRSRWVFCGFFAVGLIPEADDQLFISTQPQVLFDLGNFFSSQTEKIEIGFEYHYAKNRFLKAGTMNSTTGEKEEGFDESVLQAMIRWTYQSF